MSKLFLIPIDFKYGGGYSALIKAESIEEARIKSQNIQKPEGITDTHSLSTELDIGTIDDFDYVLIDYYE